VDARGTEPIAHATVYTCRAKECGAGARVSSLAERRVPLTLRVHPALERLALPVHLPDGSVDVAAARCHRDIPGGTHWGRAAALKAAAVRRRGRRRWRRLGGPLTPRAPLRTSTRGRAGGGEGGARWGRPHVGVQQCVSWPLGRGGQVGEGGALRCGVVAHAPAAR